VDVCNGEGSCTVASTIEGCCTANEDCNDDLPCTADSCTDNNQCESVPISGLVCCTEDAECDDGDDVCTVDSCTDGLCSYQYAEIEGCCEPTIFGESFEGELVGWTMTASTEACGWQVYTQGQSKSPPGALYYGNPATKNYDCGINTGTATSPVIQVPVNGATLEFDIWWAVESNAGFDKITVDIISEGVGKQLFAKPNSSQQKTWKHMTFDLSPWAGKNIQVVFKFDSKDQLANNTEGVYVDNVEVLRDCSGGEGGTDEGADTGGTGEGGS
jgi:hypothetical protein